MKKLIAILFVFSFITNYTQAQWQQTNGPYGGLVECVTINGSNVFAGTIFGVFLSTNNGASWTAVNNGFFWGQSSITAIASIGNYVLAASRDGIYRTSNNGTNWTLSSGPTSAVTIFAISSSAIFALDGLSAIYVSSDSGFTWSYASAGLPNSSIAGMAAIGSIVFASTHDSIFTSINNGASWNPVNNNLSSPWINAMTSNGTDLFAGMVAGGVYKSSDSGQTWIQVVNGIYAYSTINNMASNGANIYAVTQDSGLYVSSNGGANWTSINNGLNPGIRLMTLAAQGNSLYAATYGNGVFHSSNSGASWNKVNTGIIADVVHSLAASGSNLIAGMESGGAFFSPDSGNSWTQSNLNQNGSYWVNSIVNVGSSLFASTNGAGIITSVDNGMNWTSANNGIGSSNFLALAASGSTLVAGSQDSGVFLSTNAGASWTDITNNFPLSSGFGHEPVTAIALHGGTIYAATYDSAVYVSTNNGASWSAANNGLLEDSIANRYAYLNSFFFIDSTIFAGAIGGLYVSTNNGQNWQLINNPYLFGWVYSMGQSGNTLMAATQGYGIMFSNDHGVTWVPANNGLTDLNSRALLINGNDIYAGTDYKGVFKGTASTVIPECGAYFTIVRDTTQQHHYFVTNWAFGAGVLSYDWSWGDSTHDYTATPTHNYSTSGTYTICLSIIDSAGCTSTFCDSSYYLLHPASQVYITVLPSIFTGENELTSKAHDLLIYPNPTTNDLVISSSNISEHSLIRIFNIFGSEMSTAILKAKQNEFLIDVKEFAAGIYFVELISPDGIMVKKFCKE